MRKFEEMFYIGQLFVAFCLLLLCTTPTCQAKTAKKIIIIVFCKIRLWTIPTCQAKRKTKQKNHILGQKQSVLFYY